MGKSPRIVVTGAAGFIGSHVYSYLKQKGYDVRGIDIRGGTDVKGDLRSMYDCNEVFSRTDWVIHLASDMGGVGYFHAKEGRNGPFINNMRIDMNVLETCHNKAIDRLFFASSACVYPIHLQQDLDNVPKLNEQQIYPANCDEHYGWEKLMMLRLCEEADLDTRVGIIHTTYGPGQEWTGKRSKFPPAIAGKALDAETAGRIEIWGDGSQMRSYQYIDDTVAKIMAVMESDQYEGPVNIGAEGAVSCLDVAELCCRLLHIDPEFVFNPAKPSGVLARDCDNSEFRRRYGFDSKTTLEQGFYQLINWIDKEHGLAA